MIGTASVFAYGPHEVATLDGFRLVEMDWFVKKRVDTDGKRMGRGSSPPIFMCPPRHVDDGRSAPGGPMVQAR